MEVMYLTGEQLQVGFFLHQLREKDSATFFLKQAFTLKPGAPAAPLEEDAPTPKPSGDTFVGDDEAGALYYPSDYFPGKPRADVLLHATAIAPQDTTPLDTETAFRATLTVGSLKKSLQITRDRKWTSLGSELLPFDKQLPFQLPISYDRAYGGAESRRNPVGRGYGAKEELLPNIELPGAPVVTRDDATEPAGFGPIAESWSSRRSLLGKFDETWQHNVWPGYPKDTDPGYFNAAPRDQQIDGYLVGDEQLTFENMHVEHSEYKSQLPGLKGRCFLYERLSDDAQPTFREVELDLDTLWIELNLEQLILVWRGETDLNKSRMRSVQRIVVTTEELANPKPVEHYYKAMKEALAAEEAEFEDDEPSPFDDEAIEADLAASEAEKDAANAEFARRDAEATQVEEQATVAHLATTGPKGMKLPTPEEANQLPPPDQIDANLAANLATESELQAQEQADRQAFDDEFAANEKQFADAPGWTRERVIESHKTEQEIEDADLEGLDLSGLALDGLTLRNCSLNEVNLSGTSLKNALVLGADFTKADLTGVDFSDADLTDASFGEAQIVDTNFSRTNLASVDLANANLAGLNFEGAYGRFVDFSEANLAGSRFAEAAFRESDFSTANCEATVFDGATLYSCSFSDAKAAGASFKAANLFNIRCEAADLSGADLSNVAANESVWDDALFEGANLSFGEFVNAQFVDAQLGKTNFDRANCTESNFEEADLHEAQLTNANFLRANFGRADLRAAKLTASNCFEANFLATKLTDTQLTGANLKRTLIAEGRHERS